MTGETRDKVRAVFLTAIMVLSVVAMSMAFAGTAAAQGEVNANPGDVQNIEIGQSSVTQELADSENIEIRNADGGSDDYVHVRIDISDLNESADLSDASVGTIEAAGDSTDEAAQLNLSESRIEIKVDASVTSNSPGDGDVDITSLTIQDIDVEDSALESDLTYTVEVDEDGEATLDSDNFADANFNVEDSEDTEPFNLVGVDNIEFATNTTVAGTAAEYTIEYDALEDAGVTYDDTDVLRVSIQNTDLTDTGDDISADDVTVTVSNGVDIGLGASGVDQSVGGDDTIGLDLDAGLDNDEVYDVTITIDGVTNPSDATVDSDVTGEIHDGTAGSYSQTEALGEFDFAAVENVETVSQTDLLVTFEEDVDGAIDADGQFEIDINDVVYDDYHDGTEGDFDVDFATGEDDEVFLNLTDVNTAAGDEEAQPFARLSPDDEIAVNTVESVTDGFVDADNNVVSVDVDPEAAVFGEDILISGSHDAGEEIDVAIVGLDGQEADDDPTEVNTDVLQETSTTGAFTFDLTDTELTGDKNTLNGELFIVAGDTDISLTDAGSDNVFTEDGLLISDIVGSTVIDVEPNATVDIDETPIGESTGFTFELLDNEGEGIDYGFELRNVDADDDLDSPTGLETGEDGFTGATVTPRDAATHSVAITLYQSSFNQNETSDVDEFEVTGEDAEVEVEPDAIDAPVGETINTNTTVEDPVGSDRDLRVTVSDVEVEFLEIEDDDSTIGAAGTDFYIDQVTLANGTVLGTVGDGDTYVDAGDIDSDGEAFDADEDFDEIRADELVLVQEDDQTTTDQGELNFTVEFDDTGTVSVQSDVEITDGGADNYFTTPNVTDYSGDATFEAEGLEEVNIDAPDEIDVDDNTPDQELEIGVTGSDANEPDENNALLNATVEIDGPNVDANETIGFEEENPPADFDIRPSQGGEIVVTVTAFNEDEEELDPVEETIAIEGDTLGDFSPTDVNVDDTEEVVVQVFDEADDDDAASDRTITLAYDDGTEGLNLTELDNPTDVITLEAGDFSASANAHTLDNVTFEELGTISLTVDNGGTTIDIEEAIQVSGEEVFDVELEDPEELLAGSTENVTLGVFDQEDGERINGTELEDIVDVEIDDEDVADFEFNDTTGDDASDVIEVEDYTTESAGELNLSVATADDAQTGSGTATAVEPDITTDLGGAPALLQTPSQIQTANKSSELPKNERYSIDQSDDRLGVLPHNVYNYTFIHTGGS